MVQRVAPPVLTDESLGIREAEWTEHNLLLAVLDRSTPPDM